MMHRRLWKRVNYRLPKNARRCFCFSFVCKISDIRICRREQYRPPSTPSLIISGHPRCNKIYSFSVFYGLLSGLGSFLRMFFFHCFTSAVSNKLYYTADEPYFQTNAPSIHKKSTVVSVRSSHKKMWHAMPCSVLKFAAIQTAFAFSFVALLIMMSRHSGRSGRVK